jgi:hypothetical protein
VLMSVALCSTSEKGHCCHNALFDCLWFNIHHSSFTMELMVLPRRIPRCAWHCQGLLLRDIVAHIVGQGYGYRVQWSGQY